MNIPYTSGKNFTKLKFIGFFSAAVLLCVIILSSFWSASPAAPPQEFKNIVSQDVSAPEQLLQIDQMLQSKWIDLELLYNEHALSIADPSKTSNSQATKDIMEAEVSYAKILDSISENNSSSPAIKNIDSVVNSFRASLQNKQALNKIISEIALKNVSNTGTVNLNDNSVADKQLDELRKELLTKNDLITKLQGEVNTASSVKNSLSANVQKSVQLQNDLQAKTDMIAKLEAQLNLATVKNSGTNEQKVHQLQNDIQSKADVISKLQSQLKSVPSKNNNAAADEKKLNDMQKELQSKTAMITKLQSQVKALPAKTSGDGTQSPADVKKMKDELEFLKWALRSEVSTNHALTNNVNQLKQANATLTNQLKEK